MQDGLILWLVKRTQFMIKYTDKMKLLSNELGDY